MTPGNRRVGPSQYPVSDEPTPPAESAAPPAPSAPPRTSAVLSALRTLAGVALVTGVSLGVAWVGRRHVMTSPRFAIASIEVTGNDRRASGVLVSESGLAPGGNVFAADLDAARAKLLADPWIVDASLARRLPGTIMVRVTERKAAALVALGDTYLATGEGEPFKVFEPGDPVDLPVVTGIGAEGLAQDRDGAIRAIRRAIDLAAEFDRTGLGRRAPLEEVHVGADGAFTLVVGHAGMELVLGGPPFRRKLDQAVRVVAELDRKGAKADAIMLDNDTRPERVVVRMR
jgi:cell division protein FtsQ